MDVIFALLSRIKPGKIYPKHYTQVPVLRKKTALWKRKKKS